tara:strand:- start:359 stop:1363 length:1005 start_codon:yes stop_codon:yes gene_type:complete
MKIQKKIARKLVFPVLMKLGVDVLLRNRAKNSILNVMYHGVVSNDSCYFSPRHINLKQFEQQLKYYKKNFTIITCEEAFKKLSHKEKLSQKYLTISFDDGYKNNLTTALPLLEKYNIPTTFFISSICAINNEMNYLWSETIAALNYFYKDGAVKINNLVLKKLKNENISITDYIKSLPYEERDEVLHQIEKKYNLKAKIESLPEEVWKLLNPNEVIELSKSAIATIGSHGHNHFNLSQIEPKAALEELRSSKELLSELIKSEINLIAYPDGSYNSVVKNISKELKYTGQFAVDYKLSDDHTDLKIMNRHGISSTTNFYSNMLSLNLAFKKKGNN